MGGAQAPMGEAPPGNNVSHQPLLSPPTPTAGNPQKRPTKQSCGQWHLCSVRHPAFLHHREEEGLLAKARDPDPPLVGAPAPCAPQRLCRWCGCGGGWQSL